MRAILFLFLPMRKQSHQEVKELAQSDRLMSSNSRNLNTGLSDSCLTFCNPACNCSISGRKLGKEGDLKTEDKSIVLI